LLASFHIYRIEADEATNDSADLNIFFRRNDLNIVGNRSRSHRRWLCT